jgi:hypothetical protein
MPDAKQIGHAGLVGWRKAVADRIAPAAAGRAPATEEQLRALIGAAFFGLALFYVVRTLVRIIKGAGG